MKSVLFLFWMLVVGFTEVYSLQNVALGKSATQSGTFQQQPFSYGADKAVDGNTNPNSANGKSCAIPDTGATDVSTRDKDGPAWWRVDLGQEMDVYQIKIYNRNVGKYLSNTWVLVSNQERPDISDENICNEITDGNPAVINVPCNYKNQGFRRGRYVQLWRKPNGPPNQVHLTICEIEVYTCPAGFWGINLLNGLSDCVRKCPGSCQNGGTCRVSDGTCPSGCADGFWGRSCDQECHCAGAAPCDVITGSCGTTGCEAGWINNGYCMREEEKEAVKSSQQETSSNTGSSSYQQENSSNTGLVAGMAVLGVLVLIVIVVGTVLVVILFKRINSLNIDEETSPKAKRVQQSNPAVLPTAGNNQGFQKEMDEYEELQQ